MREPFIIYRPDFRTHWARPLVGCHVTAGFPSPAEDWVESRLDLNRDLIRHPVATFYVRVRGDSMIDAGLADGSIAVVDRAEETSSGHVVVARVGGEFTIKRLRITPEGEIWLDPANLANEEYQPVRITEGTDFEVWGRVVWSFRQH